VPATDAAVIVVRVAVDAAERQESANRSTRGA